MTTRNDRGDELTYHGGPLDGQPLNVLAPPGPHDDGYEVRTTDDGMILGAWWLLAPCPTCSGWTAEEIADMAGDGDRCPTCDGKGVVPAAHIDGDAGA